VTVHINRTARNLGRVQFRAARKKIQEMLEAGYDFKTIHRTLSDEGRLTICYSVFCDYLAKERYGVNYPEIPLPRPATFTGGSPTRGPGLSLPSRPEKFEPFSLDKTKTLADLA